MPGRSDDLLTGLSIGTTNTTIVVAKNDSRYSESVRVIGLGEAASRGISKGIIVNPIEVQKSIVRAFEDAVNVTGISAERLRRNVVVAFNAMDVKSIMTPGMVVIGGGSDAQIVRKKDLERVIGTAKNRLALPSNMFPLHTIPVHYDLDDRPVENPLNMNGTKLDVMLQTVACPVTYISNVITCVQNAGLEVREDVGVLLKPLASALGSVYEDEMRAGCISICVGGGCTGITICRGGRVFAVKSIPIGGNHITNDLSTVLHMSLREAETNKRRIFIQEEEDALKSEGIDIDAALEVVVARIEELFADYVRAELEEYDPQLFPGGVILSGGVSYTPGIERVVESILQLPVRPVDKPVYEMQYGHNNAFDVSAAGILRYLKLIERDPYMFIPPNSPLPGLSRRYKQAAGSNPDRPDRPERGETQDTRSGFRAQGDRRRGSAREIRNNIDDDDYLDSGTSELDDNYDDYDHDRERERVYDDGYTQDNNNYLDDGDSTYYTDDGYAYGDDEDDKKSTRETLSNFLTDLGNKLKDLF